MAKNIFTCSRTNPLPIGGSVASGNTNSIPLPNYSTLTSDEMKEKVIPGYGAVGDERFYGITTDSDTDFNQYTNYDLEYPGRGWIHKDAIGVETSVNTTPTNDIGSENHIKYIKLHVVVLPVLHQLMDNHMIGAVYLVKHTIIII